MNIVILQMNSLLKLPDYTLICEVGLTLHIIIFAIYCYGNRAFSCVSDFTIMSVSYDFGLQWKCLFIIPSAFL